MKADLLVVNANIITMDPDHPRASRMAIWQGRIIGLDDDIGDMTGERVLDLDGATVVPGFIDAHTHLGVTGLALVGASLAGICDIDAALDLIRSEVEASSDEWVEIEGYDQRPLGRHLTMAELDRVGNGRKVWVKHFTSHSSVVSSAVLAECEDSELAERVRGRDGLLLEDDQEIVKRLRLPYPVDHVERAVAAAASVCLGSGVTMAVEAGIGGGLCGLTGLELAVYQNLRQRRELDLRIQTMPYIEMAHGVVSTLQDGTPRTLDLGIRSGFGDHWLSIGPLKTWFDGGMMVRSAALSSPYEGTQNIGIIPDAEDTLRRRVLEAHASGWNVAIHAIGDRAIDLAISTLQEAQNKNPRPEARHRIEHAGMIRPDQIAALARLSVTVCSQPCFLWFQGDDFADVIGPGRVPWLYRGRSLLDAGVRIAGSTDRPIPGTPLQAVQVMVERLSAQGTSMAPGEAMTRVEALRMWTIDAAYAAGKEDQLGALTPGMLADFVVLGEDPLTVEVSDIGQIPVLRTFVDGSERWSSAVVPEVPAGADSR